MGLVYALRCSLLEERFIKYWRQRDTEHVPPTSKRVDKAYAQIMYENFNRSVFLKQVVRQAGDSQKPFRDALAALRDGNPTPEHFHLLCTRIQNRLPPSDVIGFKDALRIYRTVDQRPAKGLVNGAIGTVVDFAWKEGSRLFSRYVRQLVLVRRENHLVGRPPVKYPAYVVAESQALIPARHSPLSNCVFQVFNDNATMKFSAILGSLAIYGFQVHAIPTDLDSQAIQPIEASSPNLNGLEARDTFCCVG
ncbi:hypothetical protein E4U37_000932, partial [Claviceps purpurea]